MKILILIATILLSCTAPVLKQKSFSSVEFETLRTLAYSGSYFKNGIFIGTRAHYFAIEPEFSSVFFKENDSTLFLKGRTINSAYMDKPVQTELLIGKYYDNYQNHKGIDSSWNGFGFIDIRTRMLTDSLGQFDVAIKLLPNESICFVAPESRYSAATAAHFAMYEVFKLLEE